MGLSLTKLSMRKQGIVLFIINIAILHVIARMGDHSLLEGLLSKDVNLDPINKNKESPIFVAINEKNTRIAYSLADLGADINLRNQADLTPLMLSCRLGLTTLCEHLLEHKANINDSNILGDTPLKLAQRFGHEELVMLLIKKYNALIRPTSKK
jgi:ankyrin repeat protein